MRAIVAGACLSVLSLLPAGAAAQHVRLRVTDDLSEAPIPEALITSLSDRAQWRADTAGFVVFTPHGAGPNVFTIQRFGFAPVTTTLVIPARDTLRVHVILHALGVALDTMRVDAKALASNFPMSQFDERRLHATGGHFITRADIDQRKPFSTVDLLKNVPGVQVQQNGRFETIITSRRGTDFSSQCLMSVGVDGVVRPQTKLALPATKLGGGSDSTSDAADFVDAIAPSDIYGIEIYNGPATVPAQFVSVLGSTRCGLIMIWTRGGPGQSRVP